MADSTCGTCTHFGGENDRQRVAELRIAGKPVAEVVAPCSHPGLEAHALRTTPDAGCTGWQAAA
ncbi:MAG: hypothetical protein AB8G96_12185 [Phycisphaerales bacterium]